MMKNSKKILLFCVLFIFINIKAQVNITTIIIPPTSNSINDFNNIAKLNVMSTNISGTTTLFGYPQIKLTGNNGITLTSINSSGLYASSVLVQNVPVSLTSTQLSQLFNESNLIPTGMNTVQLESFREIGELPDGVYSLCVEMWSFGGVPVKISTTGTGCATWIIGSGNSFSNSLREPPKTIMPACQTNVTAIEPQVLVFTWLDPSAFSDLSRGPQEYLIKMVEVVGNKSPFDAIVTTSVPPFFEKTVFGTSYIYNLSDPPLKKGAKYAYVISVKKDNKKYQNKGISEVCWFTYGETTKVNVTEPSITTAPVKTKNGIQFTPSMIFEPIPTTVIKGKLIYAFKKSEEPKDIVTGSVIESGTKNLNLQDAGKSDMYGNPDFFVSSQASSETNSGIWQSMNESAGTSSNSPLVVGNGEYNVTSSLQDVSKNTDYNVFDVDKDIWNKSVTSMAKNAGKDRFPLSNSYVEVRLFLKNAIAKNLAKKNNPNIIKNGVLLGTAKTDIDGNFSISYNKGDINFALYNVELFVINNTQFDFPVLPIPIDLSNFGVYDLGEILGLALTFRLNVKVVGAFGKTIENADVKVLRTNGFYGDKTYLNPEGNRILGNEDKKESKKSNDKEELTEDKISNQTFKGLEAVIQFTLNEIVAENNSNRKFQRLFEANDASEIYILQISAEDHKLLETPLYFLPNGSLNFGGSGTNASTTNDILTVNAVYHLVPDKPKVIGRVIDKSTEIPVPDVTVTIFRNDKVYTTKTGKDGKFKIKNIEASSEPYLLKLSGSGIKEWTDPNKLFLTEDGAKEERDPLYVSALLIPVTGVVTDLSNQALNNAELKWKNGGKSFYSESNGQYVGYNVAGKHTLVISKPGFKTKEIQVDLFGPAELNENLKPKMPKNVTVEKNKTIDNTNILTLFGNTIISSLNGIDFNATTSPQKPTKNSKVSDIVSGLNIVASELKFNNNLDDLLTIISETNYGTGVTIDTIKLSQFYVKVKVKDKESGNPIADAIVTINDEEKEFKSNINGFAILNNVPEGSSNIFVSAPAGTNYIAATTSIAVQPSKDTTEVEISLTGGAKLTGNVTAAGKNIVDAEVFVEGKTYIKTKTDVSGNYVLGVPVGEYTIVASKSGLVADKKTLVFEKKDYTQDFELKDPGFDATKILGFDLILLDFKQEVAQNEFKISGQLTHIPSNSLFSIPNSKKLGFIDQVVIKQGNSIVPKSGTLILADAQLDFKLFEYLNVNLKKSGGIKVTANSGDNTKGIITGDLLLDVNKTFGNKYGLTWPAGNYKLLNGSTTEFNAFYSNATSIASTSLKLNAPVNGWEVYGVKLSPDFNNTIVDKNGISFAGSIDLKDIPGLGYATLEIKTFQIGTNGDIKKLELNLNPNPEIDFLSWKMVLKNISINQYGLRFGGNLAIPIPASEVANFEFSDVNVSKNGLNGGSYKLKGSINFFNVAEFKGIGGNPLSFGKIPGTENYKINGGGSLGFSSLLDKSIDIQDFMVSTAGEFGFTAEPNLNFDFAGGMATFKLNGLGFFPSKKEFAIDGGFGLDIPGIGGALNGSIHYAESKVSVDKLGLSASMGGIGGFSANVEFGDNKFVGNGKLNIAGVAEMGMGFEYRKLSGGKLIKADISTGIFVPIGVVTFENIGGGFSYNSAESKYGVNLTGRMVLAPGTSAVVALEKIIVGVEASPPGPVFYGSAEPSITSINVGNAEFKFDVSQKSFYINANLGKSFNIIPGVGMSASGSIMLAASAKSSDPYWLLGVYTHMNMLGLFNENLNITGAWNLNRAAHPEFNDYTLFIPTEYLNAGKINGIHTAFKSLKGRMSDNPYCNGVAGIAELCAFAYADMDLKIHSNFASGTYGFDVSQKWGAGGSANFFGVGVAGANVSVGFGLSGAYGSGNWTINGSGSAAAQAYVGCSDSGCGNGITWKCCFDPCFWDSCEVCPCPCGGKICVHPSVNAGYSSGTGSFNVDMNW